MFDIVIIGGGVIGCAVARELSKYDIKLGLVEAGVDVATGTSAANSGIVHAGYDAEPGSNMAYYNVRGNKLFERWHKELDFPFCRTGTLVAAFSDGEVEVLNELAEKGKQNGVPELYIISKEEAQKLEPNLSDKVVAALYSKTGGITSPYEMTYACMENAVDNGAQFFFNFRVTSIEYSNCFTIRSANGRELKADYIINAAGIDADNVANLIGDKSFAIHARSGEYMLYDKSDFIRMPVFPTPSKMGKGILVSPTVHGNMFIGPTGTDVDNRYNLETSSAGVAQLIEKAGIAVKPFNIFNTITAFSGMRAIAGKDFIIGKSGVNERFINLAGICSPGLSSAPAIAESVREMFKGYPEKASFRPKRKAIAVFNGKSISEQKKLIDKNPLYKNVICRCETVTEAEIIEAIKRGATTVDGIKRRVRAGMGRCQGGFCMPRIIFILSRELNIPVEEVTKRGGKSNIVVGNIKEAGYNE